MQGINNLMVFGLVVSLASYFIFEKLHTYRRLYVQCTYHIFFWQGQKTSTDFPDRGLLLKKPF